MEVTRLLNYYKVAARVQHARDNPGEGMVLFQDCGGACRGGRGARGSAARDLDNPNCWHCGQPGHHMRRCPDLAVEGVDNFNINELDDTHALFSAGGDDVNEVNA